jgi:hypothetical protein
MKNQNSKENFPGHFISEQFIFTSILFYRLELDLHYMINKLLSLINILYRFPKDKVPASSLPIPSLFTELDHHLFYSPVGENHVVQLIKSIIKS